MKLLVCGGMGFIGGTFVRNHQDKNPNDHITNVDSLTTGSNIKNLEKIDTTNYKFVQDDIKNSEVIDKLTSDVDLIVNFAAETHVDRSIENPDSFLQTNIFGTYNVGQAALDLHVENFILISTDKAVRPTSVMGATKRIAELVVQGLSKKHPSENIDERKNAANIQVL